MHVQLQQKAALVTGSTDGFGEAICLALAQAGAHVFIHTFHDESKAKSIREDIQKMGGKASIIMNPLQTPHDAKFMMRQVIDTCGKLDILVNQVEQRADAVLTGVSPDKWVDEVEGTVNTVFLSSQAAVWHMVDQKQGCIINISSSGSITGDGGMSHATSNSMLNAMTKGLAREFKDKGIRVLALLPPPLHLLPDKEQIKETVAHMTVFLSTSYGAFTDGSAIMLDGGESAG
ncbi:short-chain dehydrogenase [Bacillus xiamenensis]|uniref:SDR family NAD(P)-dependent oxidoreductase n=1 Tax=Bacillus xiamenensis TaxID=1178537 RepID=A0AAC9IHF5_9BACI|nr:MULTISPECIES: SDR family NAD(P)-dependent oxidoreductase [Bacillus]AOZ87598.1 short-chain dehydrogenase [Bacillus xiamenensis]MBG9912325.1 short-chain dehydrogenase [Bacillus xiamenensis]MCY9576159.1 SDR family NAD(P)-dependent oxidoreductase [Bacillus xiamenensis]QGX66398.1 SDR family NAD(P)-dependent oxidoreductase [Bacillus sp. ms-22]